MHAGNFLFLQLDNPPDAVLRVYNVVTNNKGIRLSRHVKPFLSADSEKMGSGTWHKRPGRMLPSPI